MTPRHQIHAYMRTLRSQLGRLDKAEADEVIREIESHLQDVVEQAEARGEDLEIDALLQGFGPPELLAAQYVAHVRTGTPPPAGFRVIQRVRQTVTHGLYYSMAAFGYSIAIACLLLAVAKVLQPSLVGAWSANGGNSVAVTWSGSPYPQAKEVLGYWLVPIALLASLWCAVLTRRVLRVLRRGLS
ncbi:MAG: HAAS signaling domain-containing protein [Stenotrophomonas sp.]